MIKKLIRLFFGLMLFSLGNAFIYYGNIGLDSWNSFHSGISQITSIPIGYVATIVSVFALLISLKLGEKVGIATIADGLFVGPFYQMFIDSGILKFQESSLGGLIYVFIGMEILCIAILIYMGVGLGSGPRDSMNLAIAKKTGLKVGMTKVFIEVTVVILAFLLKGRLGLGTLITAVFTGLLLQLNIYITKYDLKSINHENVIETFQRIKNKEKFV